MKIVLLSILLTLLVGCESRKEQSPESASTPAKTAKASEQKSQVSPVLSQPMDISRLELASEAIPLWRNFKKEKPTLVLFSADPFLLPIPEQVKNEVNKLVTEGDLNDLTTKGLNRAETQLYPGQTLSAALEANFFSQVYWVVPATEPEKRFSIAAVRDQLFETGSIDDYESQSITAGGTGFSAIFRDTPFHFIHTAALPKLDGAVLVHLDLSYFRALYKNEIKTPLYNLIQHDLSALRQAAWKVPVISISQNTLTEAVSLTARFLGPLLTEIFNDPTILDKKVPEAWVQREKAIYLNNFFQPEQVLQLYGTLSQKNPADPSFQFGLYKAYLQLKNIELALRHLSKAVEIDRYYGIEYLNLASRYNKQGNHAQAAGFFLNATEVFPDNPFITMELAENYIRGSQKESALRLIEKLRLQPWSPIYYPQIPGYLDELAHSAQKLP